MKDRQQRVRYKTKKVSNRTSLNGDFSFKSKALARNYNTNIFETININDLIFKSYPKVTSKGFYNNYEFFIKNANINAKNSNYLDLIKNKYPNKIDQFFECTGNIDVISRGFECLNQKGNEILIGVPPVKL